MDEEQDKRLRAVEELFNELTQVVRTRERLLWSVLVIILVAMLVIPKI